MKILPFSSRITKKLTSVLSLYKGKLSGFLFKILLEDGIPHPEYMVTII